MNREALAGWMDRELPGRLSDFLPRQRWYGAKAQAIRAVTVEDAAWLPGGDAARALVVVRVASDRATGIHALLLAFGGAAEDLPLVGRLDDRKEACVVECTGDTNAALALLAGFATNAPRELPMLRGGRLVYRDASDLASRVLAERPSVRPIGAEQSNTSLRVDSAMVFKLFRRLEGGENPELEIGRFLTRAGFRASPQLHGSLTYVPARGVPSTLGVMQDWIPNTGDGWRHFVALLETQGGGPEDALRGEAFTLGTITADFHRSLATETDDPAFAAEPVTREDVRAWHRDVDARAARTVDLVARHLPTWPAACREAGDAFLAAAGRTDLLCRPPDPVTAGSRFHKIRVHGDYHLGQTLKTSAGFVLIDFEGEPARSMAERRAKQPALKDVAGMVRSFDYAVEAARPQAPGRDVVDAGVLRRAFLDGYLSSSADGRAAFLPADRSDVSAWLDFLEVEKALYEVEYEANNRPAWVQIPLRGLVRIAERRRTG